MGQKQKKSLSQNFSQINIKIFFVSLFSLVFFGSSFLFVSAATLSLSPSTGTRSVGSSFSVSIYVGSSDQAMNAVSGVISFPSNKLSVVSLSKSGSIVGLWAQEPTFSNNAGTINFEGIVLNPGFTGAAGKVLTITFQAKSIGSTALSFSSGSILANDGSGTNILTGMRNASFTIDAKATPIAPKEVPKSIDTVSVNSFSMSEIKRQDQANPRAKFMFNAVFKAPGVDHYEIQIDSGDVEVWKDDGTNVYETPVLLYGKHKILVKAVESNGNSLANFTEFVIEPLETPVITDYPKEIEGGQVLNISGKTKYNDVDVLLYLSVGTEKAKIYPTKSDENGDFQIVISDKLDDGAYGAFAEVTDARGAKSKGSEKVNILIRPAAFFRFSSSLTNMLVVIIPLLALILLLIFVLLYGWHKLSQIQKRIRKVGKTEEALYRNFDLLKEDVKKQVRMLQEARMRRQLTEEEDKIIRQLSKDLEDAEKFIQREIGIPEKEVR